MESFVGIPRRSPRSNQQQRPTGFNGFFETAGWGVPWTRALGSEGTRSENCRWPLRFERSDVRLE